MSNAIEIAITSDEALVIFEWLSGLGPDGLGDPEKVAIDGLIAGLERQLTAALDPNYLELLAAARARLATHHGAVPSLCQPFIDPTL